jgi:hypothetical protein
MKNRIPQILLVIVGVLLAAQYLSAGEANQKADEATARFDVLQARSIQLVDDAGRVVAELHTGDDGAGNLRLRSGDGIVRVKLGGSDEGSALILFDKETKPAATIRTGRAGTSLTLAERGKPEKTIQP